LKPILTNCAFVDRLRVVAEQILVSAGEASGDFYTALLVERLQEVWPKAEFFGCTGPHMRVAGVRTVVDAANLAVVGLLEVVTHLPTIYGEYRTLLRAANENRPDLAILTDSPDFHLRVARRLRKRGIPIVYLVAPQVWAWRQGRLPMMRRTIDRLLCIFPFEEKYFRHHGVAATYIGHPLAGIVKPQMSKGEFFKKHRLPKGRPLIAVLPGSRRGEAARHLPTLLKAVNRLYRDRAAIFLLPASVTTGAAFFRERISRSPIQIIEGETWDALAYADLALAASGTVTVEAALLGTPMIIFYKVAMPSWFIGKRLVRVPFFSMVNLIAGRKIVPELIQSEMTADRIAAEAIRLLDDDHARSLMKQNLAEVAARLTLDGNAIDRAVAVIQEVRKEQLAHVS
jgi:lipid-A-disaccharide synthase